SPKSEPNAPRLGARCHGYLWRARALGVPMPWWFNRPRGEAAMANALFNNNKMRLGEFGRKVGQGCARARAEGHLELNWANSRDIVETADRIGLEALVPVARWKGFGGVTDFNGASYESLTWAAAMGAISKSATIFSTTHVPTMHPVAAAKQ